MMNNVQNNRNTQQTDNQNNAETTTTTATSTLAQTFKDEVNATTKMINKIKAKINSGSITDTPYGAAIGDFFYDRQELRSLFNLYSSSNSYPSFQTPDFQQTQWGYQGASNILDGFYQWVVGNQVDQEFPSLLPSDHQFSGTQNNDRFLGTPDSDFVNAYAGDDLMLGNNGKDSMHAGHGNDYVYGGFGDDLIRGGHGDDYIQGDQGNDQLHGGFGNDVLFGGEGNDFIMPGPGSDYLIGGAGDDGFYQPQGFGTGNDIIYGGQGRDIIFFEGKVADYSLQRDNLFLYVFDKKNNQYTQFSGIEEINFSDKNYKLDQLLSN